MEPRASALLSLRHRHNGVASLRHACVDDVHWLVSTHGLEGTHRPPFTGRAGQTLPPHLVNAAPLVSLELCKERGIAFAALSVSPLPAPARCNQQRWRMPVRLIILISRKSPVPNNRRANVGVECARARWGPHHTPRSGARDRKLVSRAVTIRGLGDAVYPRNLPRNQNRCGRRTPGATHGQMIAGISVWSSLSSSSSCFRQVPERWLSSAQSWSGCRDHRDTHHRTQKRQAQRQRPGRQQ